MPCSGMEVKEFRAGGSLGTGTRLSTYNPDHSNDNSKMSKPVGDVTMNLDYPRSSEVECDSINISPNQDSNRPPFSEI